MPEPRIITIAINPTTPSSTSTPTTVGSTMAMLRGGKYEWTKYSASKKGWGDVSGGALGEAP